MSLFPIGIIVFSRGIDICKGDNLVIDIFSPPSPSDALNGTQMLLKLTFE